MIPVDEQIIEIMATKDIEGPKAVEYILANRHNYTTTLYYLIKKKKAKISIETKRARASSTASDSIIHPVPPFTPKLDLNSTMPLKIQ